MGIYYRADKVSKKYKMKISLASLALASVTANKTDERFFSDNINGFLDDNAAWWAESSYNGFMEKITSARALVFNTYFPGAAGKETRDKFDKLLDGFENHLKGRVNKCAGLKNSQNVIVRRSTNSDEEGGRSLLNEGILKGTAKQDFWALWWAYGSWIREGVLRNENCSNQLGYRWLRRVDRMRYIVNWRYCNEIVDPEVAKNDEATDGFCHWIRYWNWGPNKGSKRPFPRKWADLQDGGKYSKWGLE